MNPALETTDLAAVLAHGEALLAHDPTAALDQATEILRVTPLQRDALWLRVAALQALDREDEAAEAAEEAIGASGREETLVRAGQAIVQNRLRDAEHLLRPYAHRRPRDAVALHLLAEIAARLGLYAEAEAEQRRALAIAPRFADARRALASALLYQNRPAEAVTELDRLLAVDPADVRAATEKAAMLGQLGEYDAAKQCYEALLQLRADVPAAWLGYGNVLKTMGRQADAVTAYRRALDLDPALGEAWWSLANLKTFCFEPDDIPAMQSALAARVRPVDALHLHFALGQAFERAGEHDRAFVHYAEGNRLGRARAPHDASALTRQVASHITLYTPTFFAARTAWGCPAPDPIFILGLPRAGSTLIEQILASHSAVEGTSELPDIPLLVQRMLVELGGDGPLAYPDVVSRLGERRARDLGEAYLAAARLHRKTDAPLFIDKLPNNWLHIGFIHLILPNARIIDARRHPLDCGFSNFKQHFARGQEFSYALADIGHYYRDYVRLLDHFDAVLPQRIHRVFHEALIADPEREIRGLLTALDLPFEPACLDFHKSSRPVRTASSEQVRKPINRDGMGRWRAYDRWLGPLKDALGPVFDTYPPGQAK